MAEIINSNSSLAQVINVQCKRGDSFERVFRFWRDTIGGTPKPLAGNTYKLQVINPKTGRVVLTLTMAVGLAIQNTNELKVTISKTDMLLPAMVYRYDVEETNAAELAFTCVEGDFKVDADITQNGSN